MTDKEFEKYLIKNRDTSKIGKICICKECSKDFKAGQRQQLYCRSCIIKLTKIRHYGSIEKAFEEVNKKISETKLKKYGSATYNNRKKAEQTCLEKYGVKNAWQKASAKETIKRKYGVSNVFQAEEIKEKIKQTNIERYGVENPSQSKDVKNRISQTNLEKYGFKSHLENKDMREKIKKVFQEKYGTDQPYKYGSEEYKQLMIKRYGVEYFSQSENFDSIRRRKYLYQGNYFDSSWELAVWIWANENNIPIQKYNGYFEYEFNGKQHKYRPDFLINNKIVEVKGDQFFENDKMINPYDRNEDDKLEAKHQCGLMHNVEFWTLKELKPILDYVNNKYTTDFLKLFDMHISFPYLNEDLSKTGDLSIIQHFHKSIYDASYKGKISPKKAWNDKNLVLKVALNRLKYVRSCKPSDILQGFNVIKVAPKVSVFKPALTENLIKKYLNEYNQIFDPFSGFSGRMIGTMNCNKQYVGQDINADHVRESNEIIKYKNYSNCSIIQQDILTDTEKTYECLFTCPPYGGKEHWNANNDEIEKSCDEWIDICLNKYKCKKYLFVVDQTEKYKDFIVDKIENKSHFGSNFEYIILI